MAADISKIVKKKAGAKPPPFGGKKPPPFGKKKKPGEKAEAKSDAEGDEEDGDEEGEKKDAPPKKKKGFGAGVKAWAKKAPKKK